MSATDDPGRPEFALVVEPGARSGRLLASIERFNVDRIPVLTSTDAPAEGHHLRLPAEAVFVREFGYRDFVRGDGSPIVFWSADRDRRAAGAERLYSTTPPEEWVEPVLLDLRGLPAAYSLSTATEADVARGYLGYIGDLPSAVDRDPLASLPAAELLRAAAIRVYSKAPRVQRLLRPR